MSPAEGFSADVALIERSPGWIAWRLRREPSSAAARVNGLQALLRECAAGVGFEISLEFQSLVLIRESAIPNQIPRLEFCRVGGLSRIMLGYSPLQIRGCAPRTHVRGNRCCG